MQEQLLMGDNIHVSVTVAGSMDIAVPAMHAAVVR